jgi:SAM-dependent methyltransferase
MPDFSDEIEANRRHWDEIAPIHAASAFYADHLAELRAGGSRLHSIELNEVGDVRGKSLLHLQCHFGLDSLSWARRGATVTGIDFSQAAIETARRLAAEMNIEARFIVSNVYDLPDNLEGQFDIVFTSYGAITWLPDMKRWANVAAGFVKPGGFFYVAEFHPMFQVLDDGPGVDEPRFGYPYFGSEPPVRSEQDGTYADLNAQVENRLNFSFPHSLGEIVSSVIDAGLRLDFLHEFPYCTFPALPFMEQHDDAMWYLTKGNGRVPLLFSLKATKPGNLSADGERISG